MKLLEPGAVSKRFRCNEVIVGYESTGPYAEPFVPEEQARNDRPSRQLHTGAGEEINNIHPSEPGRKIRVIADAYCGWGMP